MTNHMEAMRPKRSSSVNVDYNLKKRRIIPSDDFPNRSKSASVSSSSSSQETSPEFSGPVILKDTDGNVTFQEPPVHDPINAMTGTPLSQRPKSASNGNGGNPNHHRSKNYGNKAGNIMNTLRDIQAKYEDSLQTNKSKELTVQSHERTSTQHAKEQENTDEILAEKLGVNGVRDTPVNPETTKKIAKKLKSTKDKETKLFGQNDKASHLHIPDIDPDNNKENDDFCSNCGGTGVFLCCDTCPKSFHFACCNPPLDPSHLPEGDWSCDECRFKQWLKTNEYGITSEKKLRSKFLSEHFNKPGYQLFGALVFDLQKRNPLQFQLPHLIKATFESVHSGPQGEYRDEHFKEINEKQIFHAPYGQSVSRMDSYQPDHHFDPDTGDLLVCYHCGESNLGTWDHPETQKLIMKCDYCSTPWHLDCLPTPRASLKNLGSKWKCPLHAPLPKSYKRRLARGKQKYVLLPVGSKNNGDAEIVQDTDSWVVPKITEQNVALQFLDKVYQAKKVQKFEDLCRDSMLLDKLVQSSGKGSEINDLSNLLYFQSSGNLKRLWDFKELCKISQEQIFHENLKTSVMNDSELAMLQKIKAVLESKPKEEVAEFLKLNQ